MRNKKTQTQTEKDVVKLDNGFSIEIVKTTKDKVTHANLEGYVYYLDEEITNIPYQGKFLERDVLIKHFKEIVIPNYIESFMGRVFSIKYFRHEKHNIRRYAEAFVKRGGLTYGTVIDFLEVLPEDGYQIPRNTDMGFTVNQLNEYHEIVTKITLEVQNLLQSLGFGADRNSNNFEGHGPKINKEPGCKHLVFTRYPFTPAHKINRTVASFVSISGKDFFKNIDMESFSKQDSKTYKQVSKVITGLSKLHSKTLESLHTTGYEKAMTEFIAYNNMHSESLYAFWSKRAPKPYLDYVGVK